MATIIKRPFSGRGQLYLGIVGGPLYPVGNCDKAELSAKEDTDKVSDFTKGGGGTYASSSAISEASLSVSLVDHNPRNLAMALLGSATAVVGGSVVNEAVVANLGAFVPLAHVGASAVTVTNVAGTTTYAVDTDYVIKGAGLFIPETSAILAAATIHVDYTYPAQTDIQALLASGQEYRAVIDGLNDADSGKPHVVEAFRWKPGATSALALIADKMGRLALQGEIVADDTKVGAGLSKYARLTMKD